MSKDKLFDIARYKVIIEGITPIRTSKRPDKIITRPWKGTTPPDKEQLKWACAQAEYRDKKGFYQPAEQIRKALIHAGAGRKIPGGGGKRTFASVIKRGGLLVEPEKLYHKNQKDTSCEYFPTTRDDYGRQNQIYAVVRQFKNWELDFELIITLPEILREEYLKQFLAYAGLYCGLGVGRPQRGGHFGKFKVKSFKRV